MDYSFDEDGYVLVIGSAGVDVKARAHSEIILDTPTTGTIRNSVGGVARNIAENLARLEVPTILLTAVGDDDEGARVIRVTQDAGVDCSHVRQVENMRTGSLIVLSEASGALHTAIHDYEVTEYVDSDYLRSNERLFEDASMIVIDAVPSVDALKTVFDLANKFNVRVCADPTTPMLAGKFCDYLDKLYLVVPNAGETVALCGIEFETIMNDDEQHTQAIGAVRDLVRLGAEIAVLTLGADGLAYADNGGSGFIPAANVDVVDTTGAGDAFSAAVIFGVLNGVQVDEAMRLGATAAALNLMSRETVLPDLSQERLYNELVI